MSFGKVKFKKKIGHIYTGINQTFYKDIKLPISANFLIILNSPAKMKNNEIYQNEYP